MKEITDFVFSGLSTKVTIRVPGLTSREFSMLAAGKSLAAGWRAELDTNMHVTLVTLFPGKVVGVKDERD